ncbi:MAG: hypothetical protein KAH01_00470 [Caldisericia bacterium]|nr:hypothetical protein [Caldisericia bacterium]
MFENVNLWIIIITVFYGFVVTYFSGKIYVKKLETSLLQKKTPSVFNGLFMLIIPVLLFIPGLIGISYWLVAMASSIITLFISIIVYKKKHRKEIYK